MSTLPRIKDGIFNRMLSGMASPILDDAYAPEFTGIISPGDVTLPGFITFARASAATYRDQSSVMQTEVSGTARREWSAPHGMHGYKIEGARTNKCTNYANPTDLTNVTKGGDAAATLTVVDDSAALAAVGLDQVVSTGKVYKIDNTLGVGNAWVDVSGQVGNTNEHVWSAHVRGSGSGQLRHAGNSTVAVAFTATSAYVREVGVATPAADTRLMVVNAAAGSVVYFTLCQLEEGGFVSSEILVEGSAATRAADAYSVPNLDTAQWYNAIQGTILCDFALTGESASLGQHIWNIHDGTGTNNMILLKQNGGDLSQAYVEGTGGSNGPDITGNDKHKTAFGYKSAENNFYQNGTEIGGTSFKAEVINETQTTLTLGNSPVGNRAFYGLIFNLTYFPRRLSNPDLIDLTA